MRAVKRTFGHSHSFWQASRPARANGRQPPGPVASVLAPVRRWALPLGLAACALGACSQTSLNVAPVVDLSHANSARGAADAAARAAATSAPAASDGVYTVQKGDTLFHIASTMHCGVRDLARWNGLDENATIQAGQRLRVCDPNAAGPTAPVATLPSVTTPGDADAPAEVRAVPLALAPSVETRALESAPPATVVGAGASLPAPENSTGVPATPTAATAPAPTAAGSADAAGAGAVAPANGAWVWPIDGRVLAKFDPVRGKGIDIAAAEDAPVRAVADGEVSYTGSPLDYGNLVILTHGNGLRTVYAHNKSIVAKQGQEVRRGQVIASAGKTSAASAVLHFEVRLKGVPVDPLDYLPAR